MKHRFNRIIFYVIFSILIGSVVGTIDTIFSLGLNLVGEIREENFKYLIYFLPFIGILIALSYKKYGKGSGKGMGYVFEAAHSENTIIPKRLIPFAIISTWLTHMFGGSAGREGVAVQIGATISNNFANFLEKKLSFNLKEMKKILICSGISAGFSGLFGTPFAATIFSMEVLDMGCIEYRALFPALTSAYIAYFISNLMKITHFHFKVKNIPEANFKNIVLFLLSSLIFAIAGYIFAYSLKKLKKAEFMVKINPIKKIFFGGIILTILLIIAHHGRYSGLGTNLIRDAFNDKVIYSYDWLLKIVLTVFTLAIGFQGGEVTPLFSIGASLGAVLGVYFGLSVQFLAAIGYCAVFASATNTFLSCFMIGIEIFGYDMAGYLFISCAIGYLFSGETSIYDGQKKEHKKI